jgi:hypothetical protein
MRRTSSAKVLSSRLDRVANIIESHHRKLGLTRKQAHQFCFSLDRLADVLDQSDIQQWDVAYEDPELTSDEESFDDELMLQEDEPYMETFHAPSRLHEGDEDEDSYMHHFQGSDFANVNKYMQDGRRSALRKPARKLARRKLSYHFADMEDDCDEDFDHDHDAYADMDCDADDDYGSDCDVMMDEVESYHFADEDDEEAEDDMNEEDDVEARRRMARRRRSTAYLNPRYARLRQRWASEDDVEAEDDMEEEDDVEARRRMARRNRR